MSRTNIDLNDELVARAMTKYHLPTKKAAVDLALERLVGAPLTGPALADYLLSFAGGGWEGEESALAADEIAELP
jgi:Arc/MetJ family transcription regulator